MIFSFFFVSAFLLGAAGFFGGMPIEFVSYRWLIASILCKFHRDL
jgi:hypothetical protein